MIACIHRQGLRPFIKKSITTTTVHLTPDVHLLRNSILGGNNHFCNYLVMSASHLSSCIVCSVKADGQSSVSSAYKTEKCAESEQISDSDSCDSVAMTGASVPELEKDIAKMTEKTLSETVLKATGAIPGKELPPEPPVNCCRSGCVNCVWIIYAEELRLYYKDGGEEARKAIENIEDPSLKAFVKLELGI